jgi:hypothetical protein
MNTKRNKLFWIHKKQAEQRTRQCPCYEKTPVIIHGQPCHYILDVIDGEIYGTNNYEIYNLYKGIFYNVKEEQYPMKQINECDTLATSEAWRQAIEQEEQMIAEGYHYVSDLVNINGVEWHKGHWEKKIIQDSVIY